jgi:histidinol dehydrogenase
MLREETEIQLKGAPRALILLESLVSTKAFVARSRDEAAEIANEIAPEHLSLCVRDPHQIFENIENAGCVLMGDWTPESVADYCLGPSHTLPTNAAARFASPLNALDFLKIQSFGNLTQAEATSLSMLARTLAEAEGLPAHGFGASVRGC